MFNVHQLRTQNTQEKFWNQISRLSCKTIHKDKTKGNLSHPESYLSSVNYFETILMLDYGDE